ncbi:hypothetical protein NECAME_04480 [Necator americanus]|uniref:Uncharacterized protein n=1 Tax=Necator americanus TaxID=51031 RepID=W2SS40_NECAM|nr:hypothetical protein NECAME_04480 [Necator americanus]ETN72303.1 hypothetical protein NECAME_04480 [Necator americanus]
MNLRTQDEDQEPKKSRSKVRSNEPANEEKQNDAPVDVILEAPISVHSKREPVPMEQLDRY